MTTYIGNDGRVKVGGTVVAKVSQFEVNRAAAVADNSGLEDAWDTQLVGSKNWRGTLQCWYVESDAGGQDALTVGSEVVLNLYPGGPTTGRKYLTGNAIVTEVQATNNRNNTVTKAITFVGDGALAESTV